jgi:hypothetical protein
VSRHVIAETENVEFYTLQRKYDLMAAINSLTE